MRLSSLGGGAAAGSGLLGSLGGALGSSLLGGSSLGSLGGALGSDFLSSSSNSLG